MEPAALSVLNPISFVPRTPFTRQERLPRRGLPAHERRTAPDPLIASASRLCYNDGAKPAPALPDLS